MNFKRLSICKSFRLPRLVFIGVLLSFPFFSFSQNIVREFDRNYGGNGFEECRYATQTRDSGFVLCGRTTSDVGIDITEPSRDVWDNVWDPFRISSGDLWILRLDINGVKKWEKRFGGDKRDIAKAVIETVDGNFVIGASSNSIISGDKTTALKGGNNDYRNNTDYWLLKFDNKGDIIWQYSYGGDLEDKLDAMIETADGGFLLAGNSNTDISGDKTTASNGQTDWWLVKTNSAGVMEWELSIGGDDNELIHDLMQTPDGGYIIAGQVFSGATGDFTSPNLGSSDGMLVKIDATGNILWQRRYGGNNEDSVNRIFPTSDGGLILGCQSASDPNVMKSGVNRGDRDFWVVKVNGDGSVIEWEQTFGSAALENLHSIKQNSVGHYIVGGFTSSGQGDDISEISRGGQDFWLIYLAPDGTKKWDKRFGGTNDDVLFNIFQANDGGYMITGHSSSSFTGDKQTPNYGENDFWILKTQCTLDIDFGDDPDVCLGDSIKLRAYDPDCEGCIFDWWDGRSNDSIRSVKPLLDQSYAVTLTDGVGCQTSEAISVKVNIPPNINLGADFDICPGSSHTLSPGNNSDWTYLWSTNERTSSIDITTAGTFSVTVSNSDGCSSEEQIEISAYSLVVNKIVTNTTCREANGSASVTPQGGSGNYSITWSNGESGNTINNLSAGKYSVTVDDGNCEWKTDLIVGFEEDPVIEWSHNLGGSRVDQGREVYSTNDGGYILVGSSSSIDGDISSPKGAYDYWVVKMDANGSIEWEKSYGGTGNDYAYSIQQTTDGGYVIVGESNSVDGDVGGTNGEFDYWIVKIDAVGTIQWANTFGGSSSENARSVEQTYDGGYIVAGYTSSNDGDVSVNKGNTDIWLIKLDNAGNLLWEKTYGSTLNDSGYIKIKQNLDGSLIFSGSNSSGDGDVSINNGSIDFWIVKTSSYGNILWEKSFGGSGNDGAYALDFTVDGGYVVAGESNAAGTDVGGNNGGNDYWIAKFDDTGNIIWEKNYGGSVGDRAWSLDALDDGNIILSGTSSSSDWDVTNNYGVSDTWVLKLADNGNLLWQQNYGGSVVDRNFNIKQANDGGFIISGESSSTDGDLNNNKGGRDYWLLKLNAPAIPVLELGDDQTICPSDEVSFDISDPACNACSYEWDDGNTNPTRQVNPLETIKYVVTITDNAGCSVSDSLTINVIPPPVFDLGIDTSICSGSSLTLVAGDGSDTYEWSTGEVSSSLEVSTTNKYLVTVTYSVGCTVVDSVFVGVNILPTVDLGTTDITVCELAPTILDAYNSACINCTYNWSDGPSTDSIRSVQLLADLSITVTITDENNCENTAVKNITTTPLPNNNLNITPIDQGPHCAGNSFTVELNNSENGINYQLSDGINLLETTQAGNGSNLQFDTPILMTTDTFYIIATNPTMCSDTITADVIINIGDIELPTLTCPSDQTINITDNSCSIIANDLALINFADNCEVQSITYELTGVTTASSPATGINDASGITLNLGTTQIKYIITDNSGNQDSCSFEMEVMDGTSPSITTLAANLIVECDGAGNLVAFNNWLMTQAGAIATDNCGTTTWSTEPANPVLSDLCAMTGEVTVRFIVSDEANNTAFTTATFTIEDTTAPSFTVPADLTLATGDDLSDLTLTGDINDELDACDTDVQNAGLIEASYQDVVVNAECTDSIFRTWTLEDACGNINTQVQTIILEYTAAVASISGGASVCNGDMTDLNFTFSTSGTFDLVYTDGQNNFELFDIVNGHRENISPLSSGTYEIVSITDKARTECPVTFSGTAIIQVNNLVQIANGSVLEKCNDINTEYTVSFEFVGGFPSNINITDGQGNSVGDFVGTSFVSIPFSNGATYNIVIDDGSTCDPIILTGTYSCPCGNTESGTMDVNPIKVCGTEFPSLIHLNDESLDVNDVLQFVLHDGIGSPVGNIISVNDQPEFSFLNIMTFGTTYYVSAVAGTRTTNGLINWDDACLSVSDPVPIQFFEIPEAKVEQNNLILSCESSELSLDGSTSMPNTSLTYEWTTVNGNVISGQDQSISIINQVGIYFLKVTDPISGCFDTTSIQVFPDANLPIAKIEGLEVLTCNDKELELDGSNSSTGVEYTYQWLAINGGRILSPTDSIGARVDQPGSYVLEVTDNNKNCTSASTIIISENITLPIAEAGDPVLFDCIGSIVNLDATTSSTGANFDYEWTTTNGSIQEGADGLNPQINSSGTYELLVTNSESGCIAMDSVIVPPNDDLPNNAVLDIRAPQCFGDTQAGIIFESVTGGTAPYFYSVDGSSFISSPSFLNLAVGTYTPSVQDANGCEWSTSVTISLPDELNVDLGDNQFIQLGDSVKLEAMVNIPESGVRSFSWNPDMNPTCTKCSDRVVKPSETTEYKVRVVDVNGCSDTDNLFVFVSKEQLVFIPTGFSPNDDGNNDLFYIHAGEGVERIVMFRIFNRWGGSVFEAFDIQPNNPTFAWDGRYKGQKVDPDVFVYYAEIEFADGSIEVFKGDITLIR